MTVDRTNWLNVALMLGTLAGALLAPFHLFLVAYAVLGPLHYLTEISWLHDRHYFIPKKPLRGTWFILVIAAMAAVIAGYVGSEILHREVTPVVEMSLVMVVFATAGAAALASFRATAVAVAGAATLVVISVATRPGFAIAAYLLVTIVHVLLFTGCFILFGAAKSRQRSGFISFAVFLACAIASVFLALPIALQRVPVAYAPFEQLNRVLLLLTGNAGASVYGLRARRIMQLIAFAYTYHYLNWFSKTSIIRWHEVSPRRAVVIIAGWVASVLVYVYNYRVGFSLLYVMSILHVLLEFPLNYATFAGLFRTVRPAPVRLAT